jgi:hypothetical protein
VLSDAELFGRYRNTRARRIALRRAREQSQRAQIDFSELNEDDLVVHLEHGIGRYEGMKRIPTADGKTEEVLVVEFAEGARLYVPLEQSYLISRYVGVGKRNPPLSTLGDGKWAKAKKSAEKAVFDYAAKLLAVHAEREMAKGYAFPPDTKWQREFESSFLFKETVDQLAAINATKQDMESERPDGSADLRRRGLWQNRGGDPRRVQSRDGRQAGGDPRPDDRARAAALSELPRADVGLPNDGRHAEPLPHSAEQRKTVEGCATARWISSSARIG